MVDWKKEFKLSDLRRRTGKGADEDTLPFDAVDPAPVKVAAEPKQPFWKRSIGGKTAPDVETEAAPKQPFWKRSIGGKTAPDVDTEAAPKQPFWKRSLNRKPTDVESTAAAESSEGEPKQPFWKRDVGFGKRGGAESARERRPKPSRGESPRPARKRFSFGARSARADGAGAERRASVRLKKSGKTQMIGLKVGASQLAAARISNNGSPELVQVAREPLERGVVVSGELRDPEALAEALKTFFRRHKLPTRNVRLGIGTNRIGVRRFEIPDVADEKQFANAVRYRAQEVLPIPLDEAVLDYQVVGESVGENGEKMHRVLLIVAYRDLVARYAEACRKAGIRLAGIDLEAFALLRALASHGPTAAETDAATVVVSIGHDRTTFAVSDGVICEFTRVLDWGGASLDAAIARVLDTTPPEAETVKRSLSLNATQTRIPGLTDEQAIAVYEAARRELHGFARELVSSLQFYQNQPGSLGIGEITVTGGTAHLPGLAAELQRLIGVTVRVGNPLARVGSTRQLEASGEPVGSLTVAIGLGIEE